MQGVLNFWHDWRCLDFPFFLNQNIQSI
jgi:hypothetical protein